MKVDKKLINDIRREIQEALKKATDEQFLEKVRLAYLTRQGKVAQLVVELKKMSPEKKREFGPLINELRQDVQNLFDLKKRELKEILKTLADKKKVNFDVTAYQPTQIKGSLHPYTYLIQKIEDVFVSMGYAIVDGPELEDDFTNFEALNIPKDHPARDLQDTLWLDLPDRLMRTHTSNVQIRTLQKVKPPLAILSPGRCYRYESVDATHDYVFMQTEGLLVAQNISMAHLLATMKIFLETIFERKNLGVRVRPSYYPFVEPGVDIDMECVFCKNGCPICKGRRWIESVGGGLVHPNVLKACRLDPDKYNGFAFGFGLTRLAMFKYGINDVRLLSSGSLDFLSQF